LKLVWRFLPTMTWLWTVRPTALMPCATCLVISMSARDGVGSPRPMPPIFRAPAKNHTGQVNSTGEKERPLLLQGFARRSSSFAQKAHGALRRTTMAPMLIIQKPDLGP
jgi:hypothetical protein